MLPFEEKGEKRTKFLYAIIIPYRGFPSVSLYASKLFPLFIFHITRKGLVNQFSICSNFFVSWLYINAKLSPNSLGPKISFLSALLEMNALHSLIIKFHANLCERTKHVVVGKTNFVFQESLLLYENEEKREVVSF